MRTLPKLRLLLPVALALASCSNAATGETGALVASSAGLPAGAKLEEVARFDEPWAMAVLPDGRLLVTEKAGQLRLLGADGAVRDVTGVPDVDYGGQGGLGDVVLAPDFAADSMIYLTWAEAGSGDRRGAALGRARLVLDGEPRLEALEVIWRQNPKVTGRGHYSHRLAVSPDGKHLYIASGDRQKLQPAQDPASDLGKMIRLPIGAGGKPTGTAEHVSLGHRNILGLEFDSQGRLWAVEHGPAGGDELNLIRPGRNYGWPKVSEGSHYGGEPIPNHASRPEFATSALSWNPVIAPGGMIIYDGAMFSAWRGQALIGAMKPAALVRVAFDGEIAREVARYLMPKRIRAVAQQSDGSILLLEDGKGNPSARLWRLTTSAR